MNKNAIRNFAGNAREQLIRSAADRARALTAENSAPGLAQLRQSIEQNGFDSAIEEAACIWFSRFIALRYMEVNGHLPGGMRIFTDDSGNFCTQLISDSDDEGLFRHLVISLCRELSAFLPGIFGGNEWAELLFPEKLLLPGGIIHQLVTEIPEEDWRGQVQIVGWLYQFYNEAPKNQVLAWIKRRRKIDAASIPAATQLFTPDWIVRYMVDNTLGRFWLESCPGSPVRPAFLAGEVSAVRQRTAPEEIRFIDPCMGSGNVLAYAFDLLMEIYVSQGWDQRDAARSILENNLFGADIDRRACQLAIFTVMMKAAEYDPEILTKNIRLDLADLSSAELTDEENAGEFLTEGDEQFRSSAVFGSLIKIRTAHIPGSGERQEMRRKAAEILSGKYQVVVTNPPYMGSANMTPELSAFVKVNYFPGRADLFAAFIMRCMELTADGGFTGLLTPYVWMFIQSYEELRRLIYRSSAIETLIQFEYSAFGEATVPICSFVLRKGSRSVSGIYLRLTDFRGGMEVQREKTLEALADKDCPYRYTADPQRFSAIDGAPVAYWVSSRVLSLFEKGERLAPHIDARIGMVTGDNSRFLRLWHEVCADSIERGAKPGADPMQRKWYVLQKGGNCRFWYGGQEYVVNWENDGDELKNRNFLGNRVRSHNYNGTQQFKEGITWNSITSGRFSCRYSPEGCTYDAAGPLCEVPEKALLFPVLGYLSSKVAACFFRLINPTLNFPAGYLGQLPYIECRDSRVTELVQENISLSRADWDSFETSMDFAAHPLL